MLAVLPLAVGDLGDSRVLALLPGSILVTPPILVLLGGAIGWALAGPAPRAVLGEMPCALDGAASGIETAERTG